MLVVFVNCLTCHVQHLSNTSDMQAQLTTLAEEACVCVCAGPHSGIHICSEGDAGGGAGH